MKQHPLDLSSLKQAYQEIYYCSTNGCVYFHKKKATDLSTTSNRHLAKTKEAHINSRQESSQSRLLFTKAQSHRSHCLLLN